MNKFLRHAAFAGLSLLIITVIGFTLGGLSVLPNADPSLNTAYLTAMLIGSVSAVVFSWGFKIIGERVKNKLLVKTSFVLAVLWAAAAVETAFSMISKYPGADTVSLALSAVTIIASIPFAVGLIGLKKKFGELAMIAGIFDLASSFLALIGVLFVIPGSSIFVIVGGILILLGFLASLPAIVMETIIMFRASRRF